jgi:hypothetical protein
MGKAIQSRLDPVRRRQQHHRALWCAAWGLVGSAAVVLACALLRRFAGWQISGGMIAALAALAPLAGYVAGLVWRRKLADAAGAIDAHYRLKDRAATALAFLEKSKTSGVHKLAVDDALAHLDRVDPKKVVPIQAPRVLPYAIAALAAAVVLLFVTARPAPVQASPAQPLLVVLDSADRVAEELKSLEKFAQEEKDPELDKLIAELKQAVEELKQPGVDLREALATMSQMQTALEQQQAKFNLGQVEAQLQSLGAALALAEPLAEAGKALSAGQLDKAAEELEKLEAPQLDRQTEKALKEKLDALAKQMRDSGASALDQAVGAMSQGLGGDGSKFKDGARRLAGEARKQGRRNKLTALLKSQCNCLGECKGECEGNNPGHGKGKGGTKWGLGASGNELAERTPEIGGRYESRLNGKQTDEGEIEIETTHSPEGKQNAQRGYRETYDKYQKISEAVLESEPIPLGHRQTIRRYFEAIRPSQAETDAVQQATASP